MKLYQQRDFLLKAFFPGGRKVVDLLGMTPTSPEVAEHERKMVEEQVLTAQEKVDFDALFEYAEKFSSALSDAIESGEHDRTPTEDLIGFYVAVNEALTRDKRKDAELEEALSE